MTKIINWMYCSCSRDDLSETLGEILGFDDEDYKVPALVYITKSTYNKEPVYVFSREPITKSEATKYVHNRQRDY